MEHKSESTFAGKSTIRWTLEESGLLTVEGKGKIGDYDCGRNPSAPWGDVKEKINMVCIQEGITEIGINAFRDCENLERVVLPHSVKKICAYAFWGCENLVQVETDRKEFRYIFDKREYRNKRGCREEDTVVFGLESFHGVPWSRERWDGFYIQGDCLYVTFAGEERELTVPEGVRVLKSYSMNHLDVDSVTLPGTLETIEDFAFSSSRVKRQMILPESVTKLDHYALADCSIVWQDSSILKKLFGNPRRRKEEERKRFPSYFHQYQVSLKGKRAYGKFRKLQVTKNWPPRRADGSFSSYVMTTALDVGESVYKKIRKGNIVLCVSYEDNRVICVKSFAWDGYYELPNEYLMYPVMDEDDGLCPWRDSFTYQEKEDIVWAFEDSDGEELTEKGVLRNLHPDSHEEWFWSSDSGNYGGPLELRFLSMWLSLHPEVTVDSTEDNLERDKFRWFVSV